MNVADVEARRRIDSLLRLMAGEATKAFVSLNLFLMTCDEIPRIPSPDEAVVQTKERRAMWDEVERELRPGEHSDPLTPWVDVYKEIEEEVERRILRRQWSRGEVPQTYSHQVPFLHAHSFLYAVTMFDRLLAILVDDEDVPAAVESASANFSGRFPDALQIRHSAQHIEDRGRRLGRNGKPLTEKDPNAPSGRVPLRVLSLSNLDNDRLQYTMADGSEGEFPVNVDSARVLLTTFQSVLDAFPWHGPPRLEPR